MYRDHQWWRVESFAPFYPQFYRAYEITRQGIFRIIRRHIDQLELSIRVSIIRRPKIKLRWRQNLHLYNINCLHVLNEWIAGRRTVSIIFITACSLITKSHCSKSFTNSTYNSFSVFLTIETTLNFLPDHRFQGLDSYYCTLQVIPNMIYAPHVEAPRVEVTPTESIVSCRMGEKGCKIYFQVTTSDGSVSYLQDNYYF